MSTRYRRSEAIQHVLSAGDGDLNDSDIVEIFVSPAEDGKRRWFCGVCSVALEKSDMVRVSAPCGHAVCVNCSVDFGICPVAKCKRNVELLFSPLLQEGEPINPIVEAEKHREERALIEEKIRSITAELDDLKKQRCNFKKSTSLKFQVHQESLVEATAQRDRLKATAVQEYQKAKMVVFLESICREKPFPLKSDAYGSRCYMTMAFRLNELLRQRNDDIDKQKSYEEKRKLDADNEKAVFQEAIDELRANGMTSDDDPALWKRLQKVYSTPLQRKNSDPSKQSTMPSSSTSSCTPLKYLRNRPPTNPIQAATSSSAPTTLKPTIKAVKKEADARMADTNKPQPDYITIDSSSDEENDRVLLKRPIKRTIETMNLKNKKKRSGTPPKTTGVFRCFR